MAGAAAMINYTIMTPEEAIPYLLDPRLSPVVALDTEYDVEDGSLHGLSMAGGTPETGFFGCFWSFVEPYCRMPWEVFFNTVLVRIFGDPHRTVVMHPLSIDMKQIRSRGLTDAMTRCHLEDTVAQAYIYDDNLPHGLKPLAYCELLQTKATSYAATQREISGIRKQAKKVVKELVNLVWGCYQEHRKKSAVLEETIDPSWPGWQRLAMSLPPGMNKSIPGKWKCGGKNGCGFSNVVDPTQLSLDTMSRKVPCLQCGRERKITLGVEDHVKPIIEPVVQADYDQQAQARFEQYGAEDAIYTLALRYRFYPSFSELQLQHLDLETRITHPCVTEMEEHGLKIDIPLLEDIHGVMTVALAALRAEVIELWSSPEDAEPFNPASNDQIAKRCWLDWKLDPPSWAKDRRSGGIRKKHRRAKDGLCSTDAMVMEALEAKYAGKHYGKAVKALMDLRRWDKLMGTYVEPMLRMAKADPEGRIHSSFWPTGARSGRFSSSDPNVENIPRPYTMPTLDIAWALRVFGVTDSATPVPGMLLVTKKDKETSAKIITAWRVQSLREIFITPKGWVFVSADLSQIENRLTAYESRDANLLNLYRQWDCFECKGSGESNVILHACPNCGTSDKGGKRDKTTAEQPVVKGFVHGKDIHSATAAALGFFAKYGDDARQQGKPVNHAATYGMGAATLAKREGKPVKEAEQDLIKWHENYPGVRGNLHKRVRSDIHDHGQVVMFDGHVRRFHAQRLLMQSGNFRPWEWEGTIREGVNVLAQGGTGIGMKRAMLRMRQEIIDRGWWGSAYLVNQVHDENLYEVRKELAEELLGVLNNVMEHSFDEIDVPVLSEGGTGTTWGRAH